MIADYSPCADPAPLLGEVVQSQVSLPGLEQVLPARRACVVLAQDGRLVVTGARWGLVPTWVEVAATFKLSLIQADLETAQTSLYYRRAFERRRCLVVVDALTLWVKADKEDKAEGAAVQPAKLTRRDGAGFLVAGLYERRGSGDGAALSFALLSAAAGVDLRHRCARQPAVLAAASFRGWLDGSALWEDEQVWADMAEFCLGVG